MKDLLNESASRVFHDPEPPRFVMMDNKEKFLFGMGGYVSCLAYLRRNGISFQGYDQCFHSHEPVDAEE
jgi:hypothetical protein